MLLNKFPSTLGQLRLCVELQDYCRLSLDLLN
nr:MAG TPA: hypothetical protein [Caudoviricetes sp.]